MSIRVNISVVMRVIKLAWNSARNMRVVAKKLLENDYSFFS